MDAGSITDALTNALLPINRLPPEILIYIFSMCRDERPVHVRGPARWPFRRYSTHTLEPALSVCRHWRDIALSTPSLWNSIVNSSAIHRQFSRSLGVPIDVHVVTGFSTEMAQWCLNVQSHIREMHIGDFRGALTLDQVDKLLYFLKITTADQLEHLKIDLPASILPLWSRTPLFPLFSGRGRRLRSLCLAHVSFLPSTLFPSLVRFVLSDPAGPSSRNGRQTWSMTDLIRFLAGSPRLQELYLCGINMIARSETLSTPLPSIELPKLWQFVFDVSGSNEDLMASSVRTITSAIRTRPSCHRFFAPFEMDLELSGGEPLDAMLSTMSGGATLTSVRIDFAGAMKFLRMSGDTSGSITVIPRGPQTVLWDGLSDLFTLSSLFADVEELWISLRADQWAFLRQYSPIFTWFPKLKRLFITHSPRKLTFDTFVHDPEFGGLQELMDPLTVNADGTMGCPLLETLCINLPAHVTDVRPLAQMLASRAGTRPIRNVVIGYDPELELEVLADVFVLDQLVEELVIEEIPEASHTSSSWLFSVPVAFQPPYSFRRN